MRIPSLLKNLLTQMRRAALYLGMPCTVVHLMTPSRGPMRLPRVSASNTLTYSQACVRASIHANSLHFVSLEWPDHGGRTQRPRRRAREFKLDHPISGVGDGPRDVAASRRVI
jgi:hypothetical protein